MEAFVSSRGGRLWTIVEGQGTPVVLCGGGPGCCDYLGPVAAMIRDTARVIRFEPAGCGRSEDSPPFDIASCLEDLDSIRVHYGVERWIVIGHSWGADLALMYALWRPERVPGFVCLSGGRFHNDREWHRIYSERRDAGLEALPEFQFPPNMEVNRQGNASWKEYIQRPSLFREIAELKAPGLFLYGERDIRPSWPVEQVAALLPDARFVRIFGVDHYLWNGAAVELKALLRAFVDQVGE